MKIQKLQNYKPKDTRMAVPTHYTLLFDAYICSFSTGRSAHERFVSRVRYGETTYGIHESLATSIIFTEMFSTFM